MSEDGEWKDNDNTDGTKDDFFTPMSVEEEVGKNNSSATPSKKKKSTSDLREIISSKEKERRRIKNGGKRSVLDKNSLRNLPPEKIENARKILAEDAKRQQKFQKELLERSKQLESQTDKLISDKTNDVKESDLDEWGNPIDRSSSCSSGDVTTNQTIPTFNENDSDRDEESKQRISPMRTKSSKRVVKTSEDESDLIEQGRIEELHNNKMLKQS